MIPDKIEVVTFICSGCGKKVAAAVVKEKIKCGKCGETFRRVKGEWVWRRQDNPRSNWSNPRTT
jgi:ribosomal protein S27AE